ncbi:hypothetical protein [Rhizobium leguminosarum]|uniref:hypothetical protein n=1 Tax=Rhizobium leguminosarum TaxID=384 RepID=UPI0013E32158|nr:hypothetical protein [Rhizobium leguminosarum]
MQRMGMVIGSAAGGDRRKSSQSAESPADLPVQQRQLLHLTQRAANLGKQTGALITTKRRQDINRIPSPSVDNSRKGP